MPRGSIARAVRERWGLRQRLQPPVEAAQRPPSAIAFGGGRGARYGISIIPSWACSVPTARAKLPRGIIYRYFVPTDFKNMLRLAPDSHESSQILEWYTLGYYFRPSAWVICSFQAWGGAPSSNLSGFQPERLLYWRPGPRPGRITPGQMSGWRPEIKIRDDSCLY